MKLQVESPERELDAGGLRFVWVNGVNAEDSVRVLTDIAHRAMPDIFATVQYSQSRCIRPMRRPRR